ncbi:MAG: type II toxin-antitoxin system VapC family toxin [Pirellulaceae bacterium]|nr:type II toxin-antitoxin system VapC family toxin [Pirellulaceae bacterium]
MKLLVDSHVLLWAVDQPGQLSSSAASALRDPANDLLVSAATVWELAIKVSLNKLTLTKPYREWMTQVLADLDALVLPITVEYAAAQADLPAHHRDPFDRLLVAQASVEGISIVSHDGALDAYGVSRIW